MKRYFLLTVLIMLGFGFAKAQLTIEECYAMAEKNYPLLKQYNLIAKTKDFNISNANRGYLPQLSISGKASYQSEVTKIPISIPNIEIPTMDKDQYMAQISLEQIIWDGGAIKAQKSITESTADVSKKQLDVDMYSIRERINQLFFGILLLDAQLQQLELYQKELNRNFEMISGYIANGVANQSDLDVVKVEQLKSQQKESTLQLAKKSYLQVLSIFVDQSLDDSVVFFKPNIENLNFGANISSPELDLFVAQHLALEKQKSLLKSSYMPKLGLFAQGGYARPALNMLKTDFRGFYIAGVNLSWNISSLYTKDNKAKLLNINQESIQIQRETFLFNKQMEISQEQLEIEKQRKLLEQDDEIIRLRINVKRAAELKLENGMLTVTDLVKEIIEEELAKQDKLLHEVELIQAVYKLKYSTNN